MKSHTLANKLLAGPDLEVCITDGYQAVSYHGNFQVIRFLGTIDIGVGGMNTSQEDLDERLKDDQAYQKSRREDQSA